ncbi:MAG: N-acetylmuramoyl-L-alanine amidase [Proteobacteria bacterium]|nr:N-acetylmuramoyl-L-alanine amidase [Pseudomonadota bacterium]
MRHRNQILATIACVLSLCAYSEAEAVSICIDPGHGGSDSGATGCGLVEKEINLSVSMKLKPLLEAAGYTVYMTRTSDATVSLAGRSSYANSKGVTTFASIHTNSATATATGIETFCYTGCLSNKGNAYQQASNIQSEMLKVWGGTGKLADRGVKAENFHVLRETSMPATLTELAFINNCNKDATYLKSDSHRNEAASAHCLAITAKWGGNSSKCSGSGGGGNQQQTGKVMAGTFHDSVSEANWLGGVTYTIGSQSQVSASSYKMMTFTLNVGAFKATASKSGYNTVTRSDCEPVTAGGTSWCSIALTAQAPVQTKGTATGSVKDGASGQKMPANIRLSTGQTAAYDGNTDWSFELEAGTYTVTATANGYDDNSTSCTVTAGKSTSCPLTLTPKKGTIVGAVYEAGTQTKVAATVSLNGISAAYNGESDWLFQVDAGTYTVTAQTDDNKTGSASCTVGRGETATCNIEVKADESAKGMIRGTLTDAKTGTKLVGDIKVVGTEEVYHYTAADLWQFYLAAGDYTLEGSSSGYASKTVTCTAKAGEATDCPIALDAEAAKVEGNVYIGADPSALVAATVKVGNETIEYDGITSWTTELAPGEYTFKATDGLHYGEATCTLQAGKINICDISLVGDNDLTGSLKGVVYDARNESLKIAASVQIPGAGTLEYSGFGDWSVDGLPAGNYNVTARAEGYYENTVSCTVYANESSYCAIPMQFINGDGTINDEPVSVPADIYLVPNGDSCSATPLSSHSSAPFALLCAFGLLGVCILRRRDA